MNQFNNIAEKIEAKKAELEALRAEFISNLRSEFNNITKFFFEETPVQAVTWTQYTPYFNDGDECIFGVNDLYFILEGFDPKDLQDPYSYEDDEQGYVLVQEQPSEQSLKYMREHVEGNGSSAEYYRTRLEQLASQDEKYPDLAQKCKKFKELITANEELMKDMFGDHAAVYLTKDNSYVEEYEHD